MAGPCRHATAFVAAATGAGAGPPTRGPERDRPASPAARSRPTPLNLYHERRHAPSGCAPAGNRIDRSLSP